VWGVEDDDKERPEKVLDVILSRCQKRRRNTLKKVLLRSSLSMKLKSFYKIWKELDQMKRMRPTGTSSDHPFRKYSSLKIGYQNIKRPNRCGFYISFLYMSFSKLL
jgi:hypothetical protein